MYIATYIFELLHVIILSVAFCIGISTRSVREDLDQPVAPEVSTPTEDQPPTEKNQEINNPALCKFAVT